jgi:hypothetical protein
MVIFTPTTHCCCKADGTTCAGDNVAGSNVAGSKVVAKAEVETGITTFKWTGVSDGDGIPVHVWIVWDGDNAGSADANAADDGYVHSPAWGHEGTSVPTIIKLSPCEYNIKKLKKCLSDKADAMKNAYFGLCYDFVDKILSDCKDSSKGCTAP